MVPISWLIDVTKWDGGGLSGRRCWAAGCAARAIATVRMRLCGVRVRWCETQKGLGWRRRRGSGGDCGGWPRSAEFWGRFGLADVVCTGARRPTRALGDVRLPSAVGQLPLHGCLVEVEREHGGAASSLRWAGGVRQERAMVCLTIGLHAVSFRWRRLTSRAVPCATAERVVGEGEHRARVDQPSSSVTVTKNAGRRHRCAGHAPLARAGRACGRAARSRSAGPRRAVREDPRWQISASFEHGAQLRARGGRARGCRRGVTARALGTGPVGGRRWGDRYS